MAAQAPLTFFVLEVEADAAKPTKAKKPPASKAGGGGGGSSSAGASSGGADGGGGSDTVLLWGKTTTGRSVCGVVTAFQPYFYFPVPHFRVVDGGEGQQREEVRFDAATDLPAFAAALEAGCPSARVVGVTVESRLHLLYYRPAPR
jgi:hypothetical protein